MWENIKVIFKWKTYNIRFTNHALERMEERWISLILLKASIENFDRYFINNWKEVVEKDFKFSIIRTVFTLKTNNIILITSILLWK